jgi:hypothetical protein
MGLAAQGGFFRPRGTQQRWVQGWPLLLCAACVQHSAQGADPGPPVAAPKPAAGLQNPARWEDPRPQPGARRAKSKPTQPAASEAEPAASETPPAPSHPFHQPLGGQILPRDAPAMRYANLSPAACRSEYKRRKLPFRRDRRPTPGVATALRFTGPVEGVSFVTAGWRSPYGVVDCRLGLTLAELAQLLAEHQVTRVIIGTAYRPGSRLPRSKKRSQHAHGLAVDVIGFVLQGGETLMVERDWEPQLGQPTCGPTSHALPNTEAAIKLRNLVCDIARRGFFHYILTPNYDAPHADHIHWDIKRNARRTVIR